MGDFNRDRRSEGRRNFGGRGSERPLMHKAICSKCGKECKVPFKPTGSKPVLCSNCFKSGGNFDSRRSEERNYRSSADERRMYQAVCGKCGKACQVPFPPKDGRAVYCSICFDRKTDNRSPEAEQHTYKGQFEKLNTKLDAILKLLSPPPSAPVAAEVTEEIIPEVMAEQPVEVKKKRVSRKKISPPAEQD